MPSRHQTTLLVKIRNFQHVKANRDVGVPLWFEYAIQTKEVVATLQKRANWSSTLHVQECILHGVPGKPQECCSSAYLRL